VFGLERAGKALVFGSKRYSTGSSLLVSEAERLPLSSFDVMEHLQNAPRFTEICRVLAQANMPCLSTPNSDSSTGDNPYHLRECDRGELGDMLRGCGMRIRRVVGQVSQVRERAFTRVPRLRRMPYESKTRSRIRPRKLPYADRELQVASGRA
jgi:hypothetical protein